MASTISVTFDTTNTQELRLNPQKAVLRKNFEFILEDIFKELIKNSNLQCEKVKIDYKRDFVKFIKEVTIVFINVPLDNFSELEKNSLYELASGLIKNVGIENYIKIATVSSSKSNDTQNKSVKCTDFFKNQTKVNYNRDYFGNLDTPTYTP